MFSILWEILQIEINYFNWKTVATTKDSGLSLRTLKNVTFFKGKSGIKIFQKKKKVKLVLECLKGIFTS